MKFIFAPDSFKGSLSAMESCDILERVTARIFPGTDTVSVPVADGGEGTVDALLRAMGGQRMATRVTGPMFERETAAWGLLSDGAAVMEMAQASGLPYVPADRKDPRLATSLGTGEMIAAAVRAGVRNILIGIGGSATNDGGMGMLAALGAKFLDAEGREVRPVGGEMKNVETADFSGLMPELKETQITVICDVTNPLLGENGATFIYGPQKGATPAIRDELEAGMAHFAQVVGKAIEKDIASRTSQKSSKKRLAAIFLPSPARALRAAWARRWAACWARSSRAALTPCWTPWTLKRSWRASRWP